jgi:hypothetical protein
MNKTTRNFKNVKSGRPTIGKCRRHPMILFFRNSSIAFSSVLALPRARILAMISDRFRLLKLSTIQEQET